MKTLSFLFVLAIAVPLARAAECPAGVLGKAVREAAEAATRRSGRAAREGLEVVTEKGAPRLGVKAPGGGALVARAGDDVAKSVIAKFGDDGARALGSLSPKGAERLAAMSDELVASGRGHDWMRLIAERGDEVTDWLWRRRGSVAVGTLATAVLLQPEEFLQASERVATTTITTAGEYVAGPIVEKAAAAIPWAAAWVLVVAIGAFWLLGKERLVRLGGRLLTGSVQTAAHRGSKSRRIGGPPADGRDAGV